MGRIALAVEVLVAVGVDVVDEITRVVPHQLAVTRSRMLINYCGLSDEARVWGS
jgi:hypothetical protein